MIAPQAMTQAGPAPMLHDVVLTTTKKTARARVMGVPPEEFGIERGARTIKDCNYCFHETPQSVGALIAQGYNEAQIKGIASTSHAPNTETLSRDTVDEESPQPDSLNEMARMVRVTEHYIRMDYEGNNKPCIYKVTTAGEGGDILKKGGKEDIEKVDVYPFAAASPVPQPHRFFGRSIADLVMDIQKIKTALVRGLLDNVYMHNNPGMEIPEPACGPNTIDDLLVSRPGRLIRTKQAGMLNPIMVPDITGSVYPALQYMDATREMRTGVNNQSQGIDANALQNQSATAVAQVFSASQMRSKLIARILAEGIRDMFALLHGAIRKHGQQEQTVRLRNNWVQVDPRSWKTRQDMTINVGLGTGGKAQQFAQTMALANVQEKFLLGGKGHMVPDAQLFNSAAELTKIMGHKNPDKFFADPGAKDPQTGQPLNPPQPPPPDPAMVKVQADTEIKKAELQQRGQELQANAQIAQQADERKAQIESVQAQADMATEQQKLQGEMALAQQKFELERELKMLEFQMKREMQQQEMAMKAEQHRQQMESGVFKTMQGAEAHDQKMEQMKSAPNKGEDK